MIRKLHVTAVTDLRRTVIQFTKIWIIMVILKLIRSFSCWIIRRERKSTFWGFLPGHCFHKDKRVHFRLCSVSRRGSSEKQYFGCWELVLKESVISKRWNGEFELVLWKSNHPLWIMVLLSGGSKGWGGWIWDLVFGRGCSSTFKND